MLFTLTNKAVASTITVDAGTGIEIDQRAAAHIGAVVDQALGDAVHVTARGLRVLDLDAAFNAEHADVVEAQRRLQQALANVDLAHVGAGILNQAVGVETTLLAGDIDRAADAGGRFELLEGTGDALHEAVQIAEVSTVLRLAAGARRLVDITTDAAEAVDRRCGALDDFHRRQRRQIGAVMALRRDALHAAPVDVGRNAADVDAALQAVARGRVGAGHGANDVLDRVDAEQVQRVFVDQRNCARRFQQGLGEATTADGLAGDRWNGAGIDDHVAEYRSLGGRSAFRGGRCALRGRRRCRCLGVGHSGRNQDGEGGGQILRGVTKVPAGFPKLSAAAHGVPRGCQLGAVHIP